MNYVEGFVIAVPNQQREAFIAHAKFVDPIFLELGALRCLECWGDDVPDGQWTDFRKAVQAKPDETVVFSWIEWPDRETRDRAQARMHELAMTDERFDPAKHPVPFDGKRMIFGGFLPVVEIGGVSGSASHS